MPAHQTRFGAGVVRQATGNFLPALVAHGDHVAAREVAQHARDANRQQALALVTQLGHGASIDNDRSRQLQVIHHPALPRVMLGGGRQQHRAHRLARGQAQQRVRLAAPGDHRAGARGGRAARRQHLGQHATLADRGARTAGHRLQRRIARLHHRQQHRLRVLARVGAEQAALVGQDDQHIGFDQIGHQRAQRVVVAKFDLVVDHRVVLVDDRQHAVLEQRQQGGAGVQVTLAVGQVGVRQQHLRAGQAVFAQLGLVDLRQTHLADGGRGLQQVDVARPTRPAQPLHALGNGATGHHDHFAPIAHQRRQLAAPLADGALVQPAALVRDQAGAHLYHHALALAQALGNRLFKHHIGLWP